MAFKENHFYRIALMSIKSQTIMTR